MEAERLTLKKLLSEPIPDPQARMRRASRVPPPPAPPGPAARVS